MHYFLPLISHCFTALGRWSRAKNMMLFWSKERKSCSWTGVGSDGRQSEWNSLSKIPTEGQKSCTRAMEPSPKKIQQKDERGKEVGFLWKSYGETIIDRGVSLDRRYQRLNRHRNCNSKTTRLQKISVKKRWSALKRPRRFPFDQIFWFEIPGFPCDEWNSIFLCVGLTNPRSAGSKFRAKIQAQTEDSFTFAFLLWSCSTTLKLK